VHGWLATGFGPAQVTAQTLRGTLLERETERPVAEALVLLVGVHGDTVARGLSDGGGHFELTAPSAGEYFLLATTLGYRPVRAGVFELGEGGEMAVEVRLTPEPLSIDGLEVERRWAVSEPPLVRNGFFERLTQGEGFFITPVDLERSSAIRITELLATVPFLTVVQASTDRVLIQDGGRLCAPAVIVDGLRASVIAGQRRRPGAPSEVAGSEGNIEALVSLKDVDAVEVYRSPQQVPTQFGGMGRTDCGAIVIWTKRR
jgi:hypothetical protein